MLFMKGKIHTRRSAHALFTYNMQNTHLIEYIQTDLYAIFLSYSLCKLFIAVSEVNK